MGLLTKLPKPQKFEDFDSPDAFKSWMKGAIILATALCAAGIAVCLLIESCGKRAGSAGVKAREAAVGPDLNAETPPPPPPDLHNPVREAPASFPPDSNLPRGKEIYASGPIDLKTFDPAKDLIRFEDKRVWFESDTDTNDHEDDHEIHRAMEVPLKRLVNLAEKKKGAVKVHEAYRSAEKNKIHLETSLHCEGRAVDLTSETMSLTELAKLAWQSGFDFVLYEKPRKSGVHLHCSVKRGPDAVLPPRPAK